MVNDELPIGWVGTFLEEVAMWGSGGTPSRSIKEFFKGEIPWFKTGELTQKYIWESEEHISREAIAKSSAKIFPKESVGIAMYGATIGKVSIWKVDGSTNQACAVAQVNEALLYNEFLYYFLLSEKGRLIKAGKGGAQPNISQGIIKSWTIALPPLKEQHRIVAKIEELFSEIDKGIESLETAKAQLRIYRQSLLKHAFEGKLTAQWRLDNPDKVVPAEQLLEQIKQARADRYHQQLKEWEEAIEKGSNSTKPKYKKTDLETDQDFINGKDIPDNWVWMTVESLLEYITSGSRGWADYYSDSGSIFVRAQNLKYDRVDLEDIAYVNLPGDVEGTRSKLELNDLLITITGANVTKTGIVNTNLNDAYISQHVALCRLNNSDWAEYLYYYFLSEIGGRRQLNNSAYGAGKPGLNLENIKSVTVPFCSKMEQLIILSEIKRQLSLIEMMESDINENLNRSSALRQSILKKAFSGKLVPQDPTDEPASTLLERIRQQRTTNPAPKKKRTLKNSSK